MQRPPDQQDRPLALHQLRPRPGHRLCPPDQSQAGDLAALLHHGRGPCRVAVLDYRPRKEQEEVMSSDPYAQLAARMNQFYTGAPQTDELLAILRELFSPEEAALATALPGNSTPLAAIAERAGQPADQIE